MKKLKQLVLAAVALLWFNSCLLAQTRLFTHSASVTDRELYSRLQSISVTNVDLFHFNSDFADTENLSVELNGVNVHFKRTELEQHKDGYSWFGQDEPGNSIVLTYQNGQIAGKLYYNSQGYTLSPYGKGVVAVYRIAGSQLPAAEHPANQLQEVIPMARRARMAGDGIVKLRVLIAFTTAAEYGAALWGYSDMKLFLQQAVSETNLSFVNSNVAHRVRLATGIRVSYNEAGVAWATTVSRFQGTSDGYMDEIHTYRNSYSADVCALLVDNITACGYAPTFGSTATTAFCAADYRCILGNNTLGHEIGHLHGCRHNPEEDPTTTPYAYGHGYRNDVGGWRTVMSYECLPSCPRLPYWSNPDVYYLSSPMGTTTVHDNSRVLDETAVTLAGFRTAPSTLTLTSSSSLIDDEYGEAIATSQITMQGDFEVSANSEFYAFASANAGDVDYAPFRLATSQTEHGISTGQIEEMPDPNLFAYPNPVSSGSRILVRNPSGELLPLQLNDSGGRPVKIEIRYLSDGQIEIGLPQVAPGIYLLKLSDGKNTHTSKILINKH